MKLYLYDHCPFCVRAWMTPKLKNIECDIEFLLNDDEETPIRMIGKKVLPVLQDQDGFMGESLDIIHKLDGIHGNRLFEGAVRPEIREWLERWSPTITALLIPRTPNPVFPEFRTESARAYFTAKKEAVFGRFSELLAQTASLQTELDRGLIELETILPNDECASINDIHLFPMLRWLSLLPDFTLPEPVATYRSRMAQQSGVPLLG